jgi:hypothetical protein
LAIEIMLVISITMDSADYDDFKYYIRWAIHLRSMFYTSHLRRYMNMLYMLYHWHQDYKLRYRYLIRPCKLPHRMPLNTFERTRAF